MTHWTPDSRWLDEVYERQVRPAVFGQAQASQPPILVMVGGQPAAGKTRASEWAHAQHGHALNEVTGDDLRYLHPDYRRLKRESPMDMPNITQHVSGPLVARCIDDAVTHRHNLLLEGVFRDPDLATATVDRFHQAGFTIHVVAVAVPPPVSRASAVARFNEQGRWTPYSAHDTTVAALPDTVHALAAHPHVARVSVVDRSAVLMDSDEPGLQRAEHARTVMRHAHTRPLAATERDDVHRLHQALAHAATTPGTRLADLGPAVAARTLLWATRTPTAPDTRPEPGRRPSRAHAQEQAIDTSLGHGHPDSL